MRMLLSSLVLLALPAFATAQTDDKAARDAAQTHFQSGVKFSEAGDYEHALIEFDAGYKLSHEPDCRVGTRRRAGLRRSVSEGLSPNPTCPFR